jgi:hypothetical protein
VRTPEEALTEARRRAAADSSAGQSSAVESGESVEEARQASLRRLAAWAVIEPEEAEVYSTRRLGAPITLLKRFLVRLLRQYLVQISAQQSRFNAHVAAHVISLEDRVAELERAARERTGGGQGDRGRPEQDETGPR